MMSKYRDQLFHWDVVNENLHFNFFESKLGQNASAVYYKIANRIDPRTTPFLNEFNTIEESGDGASSPAKYLQRISQIRSQGYYGPLGIGLEGHFGSANLPYIRSAIDQLASAKLPIWVTELDVKSGPQQVTYYTLPLHNLVLANSILTTKRDLKVSCLFEQATFLDQILREVHSHFAVQGVIIWSAWSPQGCYRMCLTDNNFRNLATGNVVDKIRYEWSHAADLPGTTDSDGFFETSLFHGEYEAKISHPKGDEFSSVHEISVGPKEEEAYDVYRLAINV